MRLTFDSHYYYLLLQGILMVEVTKRNTDEVLRFQKVELRVGSKDESHKGLVPLSDNELVGYYENPSYEPTATFFMNETVDGQFLTLQIFHETSLEVNEVDLTVGIAG